MRNQSIANYRYLMHYVTQISSDDFIKKNRKPYDHDYLF